jgi:beta-lactamase class A
MRKVLFLVAILALSLSANFYFISTRQVLKNQNPRSSDTSALQQAENKYPLLAKRILMPDYHDILINFLPLRQDLEEKTKPYGNSFAMYFQYLPTGVSIGINSIQEFDAASLLKVPFVMAYYHQEERIGLVNDNTLVPIKEEYLDKEFGSLWERGVGMQVSLGEAVKLSLVDSDNTAFHLLADQTPLEDFDAVYQGLDLNLDEVSGRLFISAKSYGSILQALYFSSILTKKDSEEILKYLTETNFSDKLPGPLPKNIKVAHKIGVYNKDSLYQDCGIVYAPNRPYLLCMISKSTDAEATKRMNDISKLIYDYVSTVKVINNDN